MPSTLDQVRDPLYAQKEQDVDGASQGMDFEEEKKAQDSGSTTRKNSLIEPFIRSQMQDQMNLPPIRMVVVGDDR